MKTIITNGIAIASDGRIENPYISIEDGVITDIGKEKPGDYSSSIIIDAQGQYIASGFIDIHFHGAMGKDAMDAEFSSLQVMSDFCAAHGVTSYYPTTLECRERGYFLKRSNASKRINIK